MGYPSASRFAADCIPENHGALPKLVKQQSYICPLPPYVRPIFSLLLLPKRGQSPLVLGPINYRSRCLFSREMATGLGRRRNSIRHSGASRACNPCHTIKGPRQSTSHVSAGLHHLGRFTPLLFPGT